MLLISDFVLSESVSLWACFERLKTLEDPQHKKASVAAIIHLAVGETPLSGVVQEDATDLTKIGNEFDIRHFEIGKHELSDPLHLDYLYGRLFNLIWLLLNHAAGEAATRRAS